MVNSPRLVVDTTQATDLANNTRFREPTVPEVVQWLRKQGAVDMVQWWVNLTFACGLVVTDETDTIIETMPVLRKFIGQPMANLRLWSQFIEAKKL